MVSSHRAGTSQFMVVCLGGKIGVKTFCVARPEVVRYKTVLPQRQPDYAVRSNAKAKLRSHNLPVIKHSLHQFQQLNNQDRPRSFILEQILFSTGRKQTIRFSLRFAGSNVLKEAEGEAPHAVVFSR